MPAPDITGVNTYMKPTLWILSLLYMAMSAVAPAGGCTVLVKDIMAIETETAKAAASHGYLSPRSSWNAVPIIPARK